MDEEWPIVSAMWKGKIVEQGASGNWSTRDRFGRQRSLDATAVEREMEAGLVEINDMVGPESEWPRLWPATDLGASDDAVRVLRFGPTFVGACMDRVESVGRQRAVFADLLDLWIDASTVSRKALAKHLRRQQSWLNEVIALQIKPFTPEQCVRAAEYLGRDPGPLLEARKGSLRAW